jgi:hypothetical protein
MTSSTGNAGAVLHTLIARSTTLSANIRKEHLRLKIRTVLRNSGIGSDTPAHLEIAGFHRELVRVETLIGKSATEHRHILETYAAVVDATLHAFVSGARDVDSTIDEMRTVAMHANEAFKTVSSPTSLYAGA